MGLPEVLFSDNAVRDQAIPRTILLPILRKVLSAGGEYRLAQPVFLNGEYRAFELVSVLDVRVPLRTLGGRLHPLDSTSASCAVEKVSLQKVLSSELSQAMVDLLLKLFAPSLAQDIWHCQERLLDKLKKCEMYLSNLLIAMSPPAYDDECPTCSVAHPDKKRFLDELFQVLNEFKVNKNAVFIGLDPTEKTNATTRSEYRLHTIAGKYKEPLQQERLSDLERSNKAVLQLYTKILQRHASDGVSQAQPQSEVIPMVQRNGKAHRHSNAVDKYRDTGICEPGTEHVCSIPPLTLSRCEGPHLQLRMPI